MCVSSTGSLSALLFQHPSQSAQLIIILYAPSRFFSFLQNMMVNKKEKWNVFGVHVTEAVIKSGDAVYHSVFGSRPWACFTVS